MKAVNGTFHPSVPNWTWDDQFESDAGRAAANQLGTEGWNKDSECEGFA